MLKEEKMSYRISKNKFACVYIYLKKIVNYHIRKILTVGRRGKMKLMKYTGTPLINFLSSSEHSHYVVFVCLPQKFRKFSTIFLLFLL